MGCCVVMATKFKKHGWTDTAQEAFVLTNATKSAKMHGRIGNPSCEYISTRSILNKNRNIPICMCYDRSFRVSIFVSNKLLSTEDRVSPSETSIKKLQLAETC